jgi:hypothetical protein
VAADVAAGGSNVGRAEEAVQADFVPEIDV